MLRIVTILLLCFVVVNLFIGLYHILRGGDRSTKAVRALTIRVALAVLLFAVIIIASHFGATPD
jgi:hypothetical protein